MVALRSFLLSFFVSTKMTPVGLELGIELGFSVKSHNFVCGVLLIGLIDVLKRGE